MGSTRDWKLASQRLCEIGSALTAETDLQALLELIVKGGRDLSWADAGSLYVVEDAPAGAPSRDGKQLRFAVAQNASIQVPFRTFTMPISTASIAGNVALMGKPLRIADVYHLPAGVPFSFSDSFDKQVGYRTESMMVIPMKNRTGDVVGVLQLINKKEDDGRVVAFDDEDEGLLSALAAQAGILIERAALYASIEKLLRGFVEAAANAIEARDKTTAGHSNRIATYMVVMAKRMSKAGFRGVRFSSDEIRQIFYASLLHDVGKIGVRENVLCKADKLTVEQMEAVRGRFYYLLERHRDDPARRAELADELAFLEKINKPAFLPEEGVARVARIAAFEYDTPTGTRSNLLTAYEAESLSVQKGNLTQEERKEIESHVFHSLEFLKRIPWTKDLARVPEIAGSHHEKLNGKGYPFGLPSEKIPFEGKIMCIVDIFEALTAMDRPYKPPMSVEKAIEILGFEVKGGALDGEILDFFVKERVWEVIAEEQRRNFTLTSDEILALE